jgi:bifunctional non-homologous end joining protein LigD
VRPAGRSTVAVGDRQLELSNLAKVLYPDGTTKAEVVRYLIEVAPVMLPHLASRPVTMLRFPDGVDGGGFYEKRCPDHRPAWLGTIPLGREGREKVVEHCDLADPAALAWAGNLAALELHVPMGRWPDTTVPTAVVFDLDPGAPADAVACAEVALAIRDVCARLGLTAVPKTSGKKGLQVYVPVSGDDLTHERTRAFARGVGQLLERRRPEAIVTTQAKVARVGKVLIDWSQNHLTKTTVCAYSLRAQERPTVSTPLTWGEVEDGCRAGDARAFVFTASEVLDRVREHGDLFAAVAAPGEELPDLA